MRSKIEIRKRKSRFLNNKVTMIMNRGSKHNEIKDFSYYELMNEKEKL